MRGRPAQCGQLPNYGLDCIERCVVGCSWGLRAFQEDFKTAVTNHSAMLKSKIAEHLHVESQAVEPMD